MKILIFMLSWTASLAYIYVGKNDIFTGMQLEDLEDRMRKELDMSYLDNSNFLSPRSLEEERYDPLDYDLNDTPLQPSLRDQEYLAHSTLWGSKLLDDGKQRDKSQPGDTKTKNTLPAYCNPPNPCPVGHEGEDGCISEFENTASFSRRFQEGQDCMCDTEHMFDCPDNTDPFIDNSIRPLNHYKLNQFVRQQEQGLSGMHHKNLVAKKFHKDDSTNPFLSGERLPVAAKKGNRVL